MASSARTEQWIFTGGRLSSATMSVFLMARASSTVLPFSHSVARLELAIAVEDVALRVLAEKHPDRALKTNVEYYAAPVLMGVGLTPDLFPATFALARHAGWTAHVIEQASANRIIRPDARYIGSEERDLPS